MLRTWRSKTRDICTETSYLTPQTLTNHQLSSTKYRNWRLHVCSQHWSCSFDDGELQWVWSCSVCTLDILSVLMCFNHWILFSCICMQHSLVSSFHFTGYFFFFKMSMLPNEHLHILTLRHTPLFHSFSLRYTHTHTHTHWQHPCLKPGYIPISWSPTQALAVQLGTLTTYQLHFPHHTTRGFTKNTRLHTLPATPNTWIHKEHGFIHYPHHTTPDSHTTCSFTQHNLTSDEFHNAGECRMESKTLLLWLKEKPIQFNLREPEHLAHYNTGTNTSDLHKITTRSFPGEHKWTSKMGRHQMKDILF